MRPLPNKREVKMRKRSIWMSLLCAMSMVCLCAALLTATVVPAVGAAAVYTWQKQDETQPMTISESNGTVTLTGAGSAVAAERVNPYSGLTLPVTFSGAFEPQEIDVSLYQQGEELSADQAAANFRTLTEESEYNKVSVLSEEENGFEFYLFPTAADEESSDYIVAFAVISQGEIARDTEGNLQLSVNRVGKFTYQSEYGFGFAHVLGIYYDAGDPQAAYGSEGNTWCLSADGINYRPTFAFADGTPDGEESLNTAALTVTCAMQSADAGIAVDCTRHYSPLSGDWYASGLKGSYEEENGVFTAEGIRYATGFFNYTQALDAHKKSAVALKIEQYPGFHANNVDGWVGFKIAREPFGSQAPELPQEDEDVVMLLLRIKSKTSIGGEGGYANAYASGQNIGPVETNLSQETILEIDSTETGTVISINGVSVLNVPQWKDDTEQYYIGLRFHTNPDTVPGGNPDQWKVSLRVRNDGETFAYPQAENLNGWGETDDGVIEDLGNGRIRMTGQAGTEHTYTYSVNRYDIHEGFRVRFSFDEVPGYRSEDGGDYWLGLFLQNGTANGLTQNEGFKFLLRPNSRESGSMEKIIVERNNFTGGNMSSSGSTSLPVDVIGTEHYLTVFDNGRGYQIMIDGVLIDYAADPNAYALYSTLDQINIVFNAYVNSSSRGRFVVNIHGVDELSAENGFLMMGNSDRKTYGESGITIAEKKGAGMSGENLFYLDPLSLDQTKNHAVRVTLSLDQIPAYYDPSNDCYLALGITTKKGYVVETADDSFAVVLRVKDRNTLVGSVGCNAGTVNRKVVDLPASPTKDIIITIGYNSERAAVIMINGEAVFFTKDLSVQKFIGKVGFLGISTRNTAATTSDAANWSYTVKSVEVIETVMPLEEVETPTDNNKGLIIGLSVGIPVVLIAAAAAVVIVLRKRKKNQ